MGMLNLQYAKDVGPDQEALEDALQEVFSDSPTCTFGVRVNDERNEADGKPLEHFGRIEARIQDMTVSEWYLLQKITRHPLLKDVVGVVVSDDE